IIVLLAIVDSNYNFMYIDVGAKGSISDGGVFCHSNIYDSFENNQLNIPSPTVLHPPYAVKVPYMLLGDQAFALSTPLGGTLQSGSVERKFNEIHSRARRPVENAFGILSSKLRILRRPMELNPDVVKTVVQATVYLHNFLRKRGSSISYTNSPSFDREEDGSFVPGSWRRDEPVESMHPLRSTLFRSAARLMAMRLHLANYLFTYSS
uniref:DDE Tnp4 domain-containing protein n=1 Tax=Anopheles atroparvus TaxID=41427 RepID=A0AAG5D1P9_ANOAO